jgi:hypothetical protein
VKQDAVYGILNRPNMGNPVLGRGDSLISLADVKEASAYSGYIQKCRRHILQDVAS